MKDEPKGCIGNDGPQCRGAVGSPQSAPIKPLPGGPDFSQLIEQLEAMQAAVRSHFHFQPNDIGWALDRLKHGHMVRRKAWPQGMRLQTDATNALTMHVILRTPTGPEVPWVCSLEDLRSEDWQ